MGVQRKQCTSEFKHEAVRLVTEQGLSIAQAARDLGINDNLLSRWKKELEAQGPQVFPGQGNTQEDELARLRREVEVLRREREILKKRWVSSHNICPEVQVYSSTQRAVPNRVDVPGVTGFQERLLRVEGTVPKPPPKA